MPKKKDYIPGGPAGSQGPQFENFDFAYESEQVQKMAMQSEQANLIDIDKQIAATDKELARLAGRVVPAQGRSAKSVAKSANYENTIIDTKRFLEAERAEVVKALEAKTKSLPKSYSTSAEEKNIIKKSIEGPPVITTATEVDPPKYTAVVDEKGAAVMGTRPAPPSEPAKPKATPTGRITRKPSTIKTIVGDDGELISYKSPGSLNYPEIQVGTTASSKPIMNTGPASDYFKERMAMSDQEVLEKYEKLGADYESKLAQEQIDQAKYEFDFNKGEMIQTTGDEFERVSSQEMYVRSSGREGQVVVPAGEANKAADIKIAKQKNMTAEERRRANAVESREKAAANNRAKEILAKQEADVRKRGNRQLTGTGVKTFEVSSKGSDLGKQFSALNATFKTGPYAGKTIEQVWQSDIKKSGKGQRPGVGSILREGDIAQSKAEYQKLWNEWAKQNPSKMKELESVVKRGFVLTDSFAGDPSKTVNQAEALTNLTKSVKINNMQGTPFKAIPPKSKIKDKPKSGGSFEVSSAARAAAAAKVAKAMKNLGGKTNMLNIPIMTKGSADKIFKDFFGKQDYSS